MNHDESVAYVEQYSFLQDRIVIEITEEDSPDLTALLKKREMPGFSGVFALDDYGSGYSNEKTLLELAPAYIKLDLSIIRDIDSDPDKQQIVEKYCFLCTSKRHEKSLPRVWKLQLNF